MGVAPLVRDRHDAGRHLAREPERFRGPDTVVARLPRWGVRVAHEVASALDAPLDVLIQRAASEFLPRRPQALLEGFDYFATQAQLNSLGI